MKNTRKPQQQGSKKHAAWVFFAAFFALIALTGALLMLDFFSGEKQSSVSYTVGKVKYTLSAENAYAGGTLLVCFDDIAALCEMMETGSASSRTFFAANSEQSIAIEAGSATALLNGSKVDMLTAAKLQDGKLYVPLRFVEQYMSGIVVMHNESGDVVIRRGEYNASTKSNPLYQELAFAGNADAPLDASAVMQKVAPTYSFLTDLSAYEQYMCPEDADAFLLLVNQEHPLDASYVPSNLVAITDVREGRTEYMVETAEMALEALFLEMRAAGYTDVSVTYAYRSYDQLKEADAGIDEHQTGLCCNMHNLPSASQSFAAEKAYTWLVENCYKFGFILRYPKGKEDITGGSFDPTHYRFVGRYHASEMYRLDMCLEEYIEYLQENK